MQQLLEAGHVPMVVLALEELELHPPEQHISQGTLER